MVGDSFGGYSIVSRLGQGRSGTVYRARRQHDSRFFALKIVHPEASADATRRAELLAEAVPAGRLSHPGIARIVEVIETPSEVGIVSELAEGLLLADRLLSGPLPGADVTRIAAALAHAVACAHEHGVAGLSLDPGNVMIGARGKPIWTGLDSLAGAADIPPALRRAEDIDALLSLARRMARGSTDLAGGLEKVLGPPGTEVTHGTAAALAADLDALVVAGGRTWPRWLAAAATIAIPVALVLTMGRASGYRGPQPGVVAVLPFETLSADPGDFYLGAGLADAITTRLSRARGLTVRPMSTVMEAISDHPGLEVAASRLEAGMILQGSCVQTAGVVRARVRLVNAITGAGIWERDFDSGSAAHGSIDQEIASQTLGSLMPGASGQDDSPRDTGKGDRRAAHYLYLLARGRMADYETWPLKEAVQLLERATMTEPSFQPAYAALSEASVNMFLGGLSSDRTWLARGIAAGHRAVTLDPADPAAHFSLGYALLYSGEPVRAVREILGALRIDRSHPASLRLMSALLSQAGAARPARALRDRAARLAPSLASGWSDAYLAAVEGRMDEAIDMLEGEIDSRRAAGRPTEIPVQTLGFLAFETGDATAGLRWAAMLEDLSANAVYADMVRLLALARMGDAAAVRSILERGRAAYWQDWEYALWIARALALVGDRQESLVWLSRCAELGAYDASALKRGGFFSEVGDDPVYRRAEFAVTSRARQILDLAASEGYL